MFPNANASTKNVMDANHRHHPVNDETYLMLGRNTDLKNLAQEGTASFDGDVKDIEALVRMDVGESLTSTGKGGENPVIRFDETLYQEPNKS